MKQKQPATSYIGPEPESVRRKFAAELRKLAQQTKWTEAERGEFARMAESWERTLPEK
jgi:hypothetical protein